MADFSKAVDKTLRREGDYNETQNDNGGATKYGISQRAYPHLNIKNITVEQAKEIYRADYWNKINGDLISSQLMADNIFDTAVNMGVKTASRLAQVAIGIDPADGVIGKQSIAKLNAYDDKSFVAVYTLAKVARYASICNKDKTQSKFLLGWINRCFGGNP